MTVATTSSRMTEAEALLALSNQSETDADEGIVSDQSSASSTASSSDLILQQDSGSKTIKVRKGGRTDHWTDVPFCPPPSLSRIHNYHKGSF